MVQAVGAADIGAVDVLVIVKQLLDTCVGAHTGAGIGLDAVGKGLGALGDRVDSGNQVKAAFAGAPQLFVAVRWAPAMPPQPTMARLMVLPFFCLAI